jgi:hypothetical protein
MDVIWIDKVEVARRQLITAIRLFFEEADRVSVHTLVASCHQILVDVGGKKGIYGAMKSAKVLQGDYAQDYLRSINGVFNFMKHADRDGEKQINIAPLSRFTSDFLMDAILLMRSISGVIPTEGKVFWIWFVTAYPGEFENLPPESEVRKFQKMGIEKWNFRTIRQFLLFAEIVGNLPFTEAV